jgi:hypothetical protein
MKVFVSSQIRGYQKFMAGKNVHSWCGTRSKSSIPTAGSGAASKTLDRARGQNVTTDEAGEGAQFKHREARSPP